MTQGLLLVHPSLIPLRQAFKMIHKFNHLTVNIAPQTMWLWKE